MSYSEVIAHTNHSSSKYLYWLHSRLFNKASLKHTESIELSTFCIIPCQPSLDDCRSAMATVDVIKKFNKKFSFVITRCPASGDDFEEAKNSLAAVGMVCSSYTAERKCYKRAYAESMGVSEYDEKDKASIEIPKIFQWVLSKEKKLASEVI